MTTTATTPNLARIFARQIAITRKIKAIEGHKAAWDAWAAAYAARVPASELRRLRDDCDRAEEVLTAACDALDRLPC